MSSARSLFTSTLLQNGTVLVAGGVNSSGFVSSAELYAGLVTLTLEAATQGTITSDTNSYCFGSTAILTATPNPGYLFTGWTGDVTGSDNPLSVLMGNKNTIAATYGQDTNDDDGDDLTNYEVFKSKSPLDILDYPDLVVEVRKGIEVLTDIELTFPSALGKTYRIKDSVDLSNWDTVESGISGNGRQTQRFYTPRNMPKRFFRVEEDVAP